MADVVEPSPELEALTRNVQNTFSEIIEQIPYLPEELQLAVTNLDDPSALGHLIAGRAADLERGEAGAARGGRRRQAAAPPLGDPHPRARGGPPRHQDPVAGRVRDRQGPARVLPAPADEGDPGGARRGGRPGGRGGRAARADRGREAARGGARRRPSASSAGSRSCPPPPPSTASSAPTSSGSSTCPGRRRPRTTSTSSTRKKVLDDDHYDLEEVKDRILEYLAVRKLNPESPGPDPLLRRPARRRQDQPRQVDRPRPRPQVRAHLGRRRPRRGRDPRATAAPTSARCPERSSAPCATRAPATRCS